MSSHRQEIELELTQIHNMNDQVSKEVDNELKEKIDEEGFDKTLAVVPEGSMFTVINEESQKLLNIARSLGWEKIKCKIFERPQGSDDRVGTTAPTVVSPNP